MKRLSKTEILGLAVVILAIVLRFQDLTLRPFHHDEGVNGFFLTRLVREGIYKYDPGNYHGPTLYYLTLPLVAAFGLSDVAVRGTEAVFGVLTVFALWRFLLPAGVVFSLAAAALFATSPGAVFFSRYFIHETLFVAFTLLALANAPRPEHQPRWRFLATGVFVGLLFATKETAFVSAGAVLGGVVMAAWLVNRQSPLAIVRATSPYVREHIENLTHGFLAFLATAGLFYSSFFRNPEGVLDAFRTFAFWTQTAVRDHDNPWNQHLLWIREADPVLFHLGLAGGVLALILRRSFVGVMSAVWTILIVFAYSVVKYKTPWLGLNMLLPLAICAGYLIHEIACVEIASARVSMKPAAALIALLGASLSASQSLELETQKYDDETLPYVYAHTQRVFLNLVRAIDARAQALGTREETGIAIFAPENWPLPWYLRNYKRSGYWGEFKKDVDVDIYVGSLAQDAQIREKVGDGFDRIGVYNMRGVVDLVLYARKVKR